MPIGSDSDHSYAERAVKRGFFFVAWREAFERLSHETVAVWITFKPKLTIDSDL